ncbi:hypothetical protein B0H19DRAFT_657955 [Mycena capillaripes]|nr:hypothetical protein B0H19DRAFT_657955 [Mycena capillaripes]
MTTMLKTGECSRCTTEKIRCNGLDPCTPCSKSEATSCLPCRRKKRRCDGQKPCQTCAFSRSNIPCEYPDETVATWPMQKPAAKAVPPDNHINVSPEFLQYSVVSGSSAVFSIQNLAPSDVGVLDLQSSSPFAVAENPLPSGNPATLHEFHQELLLPPEECRHELFKTPFYGWKTPPSRIDNGPDPLLPPRDSELQLEISIHSLPDVGDDLSGIRKLFLKHRIQFGLSVPTSTLAAIEHGVPDDTLLHPALLHACQLLGYMLAHHLQHTPWISRSELEVEQMQLALGGLDNSKPGAAPRPIACLQIVTLLSLYCFTVGDVARARELIRTGNDFVREFNLDVLVSASAPPLQEYSRASFQMVPATVEAEAQAAIAQLIYLDMAYAVTLRLPSIIDPLLGANIKALMNRPNLNAEMNYVNMKSVSLLFEAQQIAAQWYQHPGFQEAEWQLSYWAALEALDAHRSFLTLTLTRIAFSPDLRTVGLSLKMCAVMALTGLSMLFGLFALDNVELKQKEHAAIGEIISISMTFTDDDCDNLDPVQSGCWTEIVGALDRYTVLGPDAAKTTHDISAMAGLVRERNSTLQRVLPLVADV